ncbi:hypothetical protein DM2_2141 [Halorubrum sp. DM2]|nr:hypothetical protein DM2_2141 [Halorubrum sp. DM2]
MTWTYLRDLERAESHIPAELDNQVVAVTASHPAEFAELIVAEPHFVLV